MRKVLFTLIATTSAVIFVTPGQAASLQQELQMCGTALDHQKLAAKEDYRMKLIRARGGKVRQLKINLIPYNKSLEKLKAQCRIAQGIVEEVFIVPDSRVIISKKD